MKLTRMKAGEKFVPREGAINAWCDAAERLAPNFGAAGGSGTASGTAGPALVVQVKNNTGEQLDEFETFCADHNTTGQSGQLTIEDNEYAVGVSPTVCIGQVDKEEGSPHLLILQEPIPAGEFGRAVVRGVCIAKVDIVSTTHTYADLPTTGSVLRSGPGGRVRILQLGELATGEQYCLVDLMQSAVGGPVVQVTGAASGGLYPGVYTQRSETSPYSYVSTSVEVRIIAVGGGTLQSGRQYLGQPVGQVTISDVVYDLIDVVGDANYTTLNGSSQETAWAGGLLNTTTQSIKGVKTFRDYFRVEDELDATTYTQVGPSTGSFVTSSSAINVNSGIITINGDVPYSLGSSLPMAANLSLQTDYPYPCLFIGAESPGSPDLGGVATGKRFGIGQPSGDYDSFVSGVQWGGTATIVLETKNHAGTNETHTFTYAGGLFVSYGKT